MHATKGRGNMRYQQVLIKSRSYIQEKSLIEIQQEIRSTHYTQPTEAHEATVSALRVSENFLSNNPAINKIYLNCSLIFQMMAHHFSNQESFKDHKQIAIECFYLHLNENIPHSLSSTILITLGKKFFLDPISYSALLLFLLERNTPPTEIIDSEYPHYYFMQNCFSFDTNIVELYHQFATFSHEASNFRTRLSLEPCRMRGFTNKKEDIGLSSTSLTGNIITHTTDYPEIKLNTSEFEINIADTTFNDQFYYACTESCVALFTAFNFGFIAELFKNKNCQSEPIQRHRLLYNVNYVNYKTKLCEKIIKEILESPQQAFFLDYLPNAISEINIPYTDIKRILKCIQCMVPFQTLLTLVKQSPYYLLLPNALQFMSAEETNTQIEKLFQEDFDKKRRNLPVLCYVLHMLTDTQPSAFTASINKLKKSIFVQFLELGNHVTTEDLLEFNPISYHIRPDFQERFDALYKNLSSEINAFISDQNCFSDVEYFWGKQLSETNMICYLYESMNNKDYYPRDIYSLIGRIFEKHCDAKQFDHNEILNKILQGRDEEFIIRALKKIPLLINKTEDKKEFILILLSHYNAIISELLYRCINEKMCLFDSLLHDSDSDFSLWIVNTIPMTKQEFIQNFIRNDDKQALFLKSNHASPEYVCAIFKTNVLFEDWSRLSFIITELSFAQYSLEMITLILNRAIDNAHSYDRHNKPLHLMLYHLFYQSNPTNEALQFLPETAKFLAKKHEIEALRWLCNMESEVLRSNSLPKNNLTLYFEVLTYLESSLEPISYTLLIYQEAYRLTSDGDNVFHIAAKENDYELLKTTVSFFKARLLPKEIYVLLQLNNALGGKPSATLESINANIINAYIENEIKELERIYHFTSTNGELIRYREARKRARSPEINPHQFFNISAAVPSMIIDSDETTSDLTSPIVIPDQMHRNFRPLSTESEETESDSDTESRNSSAELLNLGL